MKFNGFKLLTGSTALLILGAASSVDAQNTRTLERKLDRNERQIQRQANRADYYTTQTWQQINPWIEQNGIAPMSNAARSAVNAAGRAVAQTADAATRRMDGRFGFQDKSQANVWFYDYYTYSPTYYSHKSDSAYSGAVRYFDSDNDGVYESYGYYRDSDSDGRYDEYDRVDFFAQTSGSTKTSDKTSEPSEAKSEYTGPEDARRYTVKGKIEMIKTATVNGNKHLIVGINQEKESTLAIDLGLADSMKDKNVEVGKSIEATGAMETVGEKQVLVADSVKIGDGERIEIAHHNGVHVTGKVVDVKTTTIGSVESYLAIVEVDNQRQLVDLGPTATYKVKLLPSTKITLRGIPVRSQDHRVLMAERVELDGEVYTVDRMKNFKF
ncbi:MAG: hypothetical protein ABL888_06435 [Pirellulaceae bacterium]